MGDYGGPIAQDRMWREEISRDAIENSNGANGFLARGPYRAITRWHVLTIFQPLNPRAPSSPSLPPSLSPKADLLVLREPRCSVWLSPSLCCCCLSLSATANISKHLKKGKTFQRVCVCLSQFQKTLKAELGGKILKAYSGLELQSHWGILIN